MGLDRATLARLFIRGEGLEIGALHNPMPLPSGVRVHYVDRLPVEELRRHYPELAHERLVPVEILEDGERLTSIPDESQDFVIANGFLEHCENPLGALVTFTRVLKPGGILFLAVPDKRFTFDRDRPVTPLEHLWSDYIGRPARPRREAFEEWTRLVYKIQDEAARRRRTDELEAMNYSIHHHVWTETEILELLVGVQRRLGLDLNVLAISRWGYELDIVLCKGTAEGSALRPGTSR